MSVMYAGVALTTTTTTQGLVVGSVPKDKFLSGCGPTDLAGAIQSFIAAFNTGDQTTLSRFIPAASATRTTGTTRPNVDYWFPWPPPTPVRSKNSYTTREAVLAFFAARHQQEERWRLLGLSLAPAEPSGDMIDFQILIERSGKGNTPDIGLGVGTFSCKNEAIPVLGLQPAPAGLVKLVPPFVSTPAATPTISDPTNGRDESSACGPDNLRHAVQRFFEAFNSGDQAALTRIVPANARSNRQPQSRGLFAYRVFENLGEPGSGCLTNVYDEVLSYFASRHKHHEQLQLIALTQVGLDPSNIGMAFTPYFARWADDVAPHVATGKFVMYCPDFQIETWVQGPAPAILPARGTT